MLLLYPHILGDFAPAEPSVSLIGGTLRKSGTGQPWRLVSANHGVGIGECSVDAAGVLTMMFSQSGTLTGFGSVTVDKALAARGVSVGVVAKSDRLLVTFYKRNASTVRRVSADSSDSVGSLYVLWTVVR